MEKNSLIHPEALSMIGSETRQGEPYHVSREVIRTFKEAIMEDASLSGHEKAEAPLTFGIYNCRNGLDRDFNIPLDAPRRVRGEDEFQFLAPILEGDTISAKTKLLDIYQRQGGTGSMVFVVTETTYTNQRSEVVMIDKATIIRR